MAQLLLSVRHSNFILDTDILINSVIEESERLKNQHARSQRGQGEKKEEGLTNEALAAMGSEGSRGKRHKGNCHSCGKPRHWAHKCRKPKENDATRASNTQKSGSTPPAKSKNQPTGSANTVAEHSFEGNGFWTVVEEEVAPALTFGADPDPILGDPDETGIGPQNLDLSFTWDGPDNWLSNKAAEIEEEELAGVTVLLPVTWTALQINKVDMVESR